MKEERLDTSALEKSIIALEEAINLQQDLEVLAYIPAPLFERMDSLKARVNEGTIQCFEVCYEVSFKMLKRYLTLPDGLLTDAVQGMDWRHWIRMGYEKGILASELSTWLLFREMRNKTSHTYTPTAITEILEITPAFLEEAKFLWQRIQEHVYD